MHFNYGNFNELDVPSSSHIKHLACGIKGDYPGKHKPWTTTSTTTTPAPGPAEPASKPDVQPEVGNTEN